MSQSTLPFLVAIPRPYKYDLPPLWDGHPVKWVGWREGLNHPHLLSTCEDCGSIAPQQTNRGVIARTRKVTVEARLPSGKSCWRQQDWHSPLTELMAFRCGHCGADTVLDNLHDRAASRTWTLDDTDYGHCGSNQSGDPS